MQLKLSNEENTRFHNLIVCQLGEPKDGPILVTNYYGYGSVTKRLVYYAIAEYSHKSINKFRIRDEAYDDRGRLETGFALVLDVKDETCVVEETKML